MSGITVPSNSPLDGTMHICQFSVDWLPIVTGALSDLLIVSQWESPPADIIPQVDTLIELIETDVTIPDQIPIGMIAAFSDQNGAVPAKWLWADGSTKSRTTYAALFAVCGTQYGAGDGSTTFNIPDLRGRFVYGVGVQNSANMYTSGGEVQHTLTIGEIPAHHHQQHVDSNSLAWQPGGAGSRHNIATGSPGTSGTALITEDEGGGTNHNNMPPYRELAYGIYAGV